MLSSAKASVSLVLIPLEGGRYLHRWHDRSFERL